MLRWPIGRWGQRRLRPGILLHSQRPLLFNPPSLQASRNSIPPYSLVPHPTLAEVQGRRCHEFTSGGEERRCRTWLRSSQAARPPMAAPPWAPPTGAPSPATGSRPRSRGWTAATTSSGELSLARFRAAGAGRVYGACCSASEP